VSSEYNATPRVAARLELEARQLVEQRVGRDFDDAEWKRMRGKLIEFYDILRAREEQAAKSLSRPENG
jgi:hypothetical protein